MTPRQELIDLARACVRKLRDAADDDMDEGVSEDVAVLMVAAFAAQVEDAALERAILKVRAAMRGRDAECLVNEIRALKGDQ